MSAEVRVVLFDIAPELLTVDPTELARIDRFIERACNRVNDKLWDCKALEGKAYLSAHMLTLANNPTATRTKPKLKRQKIRKTEFEFFSSSERASLGETTYGRMYMELADTIWAAPRAINFHNVR